MLLLGTPEARGNIGDLVPLTFGMKDTLTLVSLFHVPLLNRMGSSRANITYTMISLIDVIDWCRFPTWRRAYFPEVQLTNIGDICITNISLMAVKRFLSARRTLPLPDCVRIAGRDSFIDISCRLWPNWIDHYGLSKHYRRGRQLDGVVRTNHVGPA